MTRFGIDISAWQEPGKINYDLLAEEIQFAILRAGFTGHGTGSSYHEDQYFNRHYEEFSKRGIPLGAYWYSCADMVEEGIAEAKACLKAVQNKQLAYPIFFDTEDNFYQRKASPAALTDATIAFCQTIEEAGYYVGIYASADWFKNELQLDRLTAYDKWVANWQVTKPNFEGPYGLWQFTSSIQLSGYAGRLDGNYAYKDYPAIMKVHGLNRYSKEPASKPSVKTIDELAQEVLSGVWGNGSDRKNRLVAAGHDYDAIQVRVNERLRLDKTEQSIDELAREVILGDWGNGEDRKKRLSAAGYDYNAVQSRVNSLLKR